MPPRGKGKSAAAAKPILNGCVVAVAGSDLGRDGWKDGDVARWVGAWGGAFSAEVGDGVTHLLATAAQFRDAKNARVGRARRLRGVHVVDPDWLEDSITSRKRAPEKRYSLREAQRRENAKRKVGERARKGLEKGKRLVNDCVNHIYSDSTFFRYEIELTRNDEDSGNVGQKYQICIWESNGKPHHYQMTAKYYSKPRDSQPAVHRFPEEAPALFDPVFKHFKRFFEKKTNIKWDERLENVGSQPKKYWQYQPPCGGKPVGLVNGQIPSIFGNGSYFSIPRDADPADENDDNESAAADQQAITTGEPATSSGATVDEHGAGGGSIDHPMDGVSLQHGSASFSGDGGVDEDAELAAKLRILAEATASLG